MMINALTWLFGYLFTLLQNDNIDQLHSRHGVNPLVNIGLPILYTNR